MVPAEQEGPSCYGRHMAECFGAGGGHCQPLCSNRCLHTLHTLPVVATAWCSVPARHRYERLLLSSRECAHRAHLFVSASCFLCLAQGGLCCAWQTGMLWQARQAHLLCVLTTPLGLASTCGACSQLDAAYWNIRSVVNGSWLVDDALEGYSCDTHHRVWVNTACPAPG